MCQRRQVRKAGRWRPAFVYNLHFEVGARDPDGSQRLDSARKLAEHISERDPSDEPVIITGDFNARLQHKSVQYLLGEYGASPVELSLAATNTYIDHIICGPSNAVEGVSQSVTWPGFSEGRSGSDHPAVTAKVRLGN